MLYDSKLPADKERLLASYRARHFELEKVIKEWCLAQNEFQKECTGDSRKTGFAGCGFPRPGTREKLYKAGNELFRIACVSPWGGVYTKTRDKLD
jgi:hypothetical protein